MRARDEGLITVLKVFFGDSFLMHCHVLVEAGTVLFI